MSGQQVPDIHLQRLGKAVQGGQPKVFATVFDHPHVCPVHAGPVGKIVLIEFQFIPVMPHPRPNLLEKFVWSCRTHLFTFPPCAQKCDL